MNHCWSGITFFLIPLGVCVMRILRIVVYSSRVRVLGDIIVVDTIRVYQPFKNLHKNSQLKVKNRYQV